MTPAEQVTLHHGDCIEVMRTLPDASVDAVVTDPPYNLSDSGKRDADCLRRVLADVRFPHADEGDVEGFEGGNLASPCGGVTHLHGEDGTIGEDARVGMPEGAVDLQRPPVVEQEVKRGNVSAAGASNAVLPSVADAETVEHLGDFILDAATRGDTPFCNGTCSCFTEPGPGLLAMTVRAVTPTSGPNPLVELGRERGSDADVRLGDRAAGQPQGAASVVADAGAVDALVLRLDLSRRTGELRAAHGARALHGAPGLRRTQLVGASAGARGLPPVLEPYRVRLVGDGADRTLTLHLPAEIRHTVYPSRAGGFMGKAWDGWYSPASFQRWCAEWTAEALRVLRPGGHLLAFGGSRTWHRLAVAVEDAGFEVRDSIAWLYGSGFPKSLDVSKAIDKAAGAEREVVGEGATFGAGSLRNRTRVEQGYRPTELNPEGGAASITAPATPAAQQWQGWGTALKPAFEPVVVARKPLESTVAANVLEWGTGALNIDATRVPSDGKNRHAQFGTAPGGNNVYGDYSQTPVRDYNGSAGRWPTNVVLDGRAADELDATGPHSKDGVAVNRNREPGTLSSWYGKRASQTGEDVGYGGEGGPSRFFPVFRYQAKAPTRERPKVGDTAHPTVKPLALMEWLVRLVTPPGGVVLEPFAGSGTTVEACLTQGFRCIAIEREADYLPLIEARIARAVAAPPALFPQEGVA